MGASDLTVEDMENILGELYRQVFGGSLEELKSSKLLTSKQVNNPDGLNPGLDRCTIMGTNKDKDIEIHFQDTPECRDARDEYTEILTAALGGAETIYRTLK